MMAQDILMAKPALDAFLISRTFDAPRAQVWEAWTVRARLMQWFGPKSFTMPAAKLDFRPGGSFHYCLCAPDGKETWGKLVYREILEPKRIVFTDSFSDEDGGITRHPVNANWPLEMLSTVTLVEENGSTTLTFKCVPINSTETEIRTFDSARGDMRQGWMGTFYQLGRHMAQSLN